MSVVRIVTRILPSGVEPESAPHLLDPGQVGEPLDREWSQGEAFVAETTFCKENALPAGADPDRAAALHGVSGLVCLKKSRLRLTTEAAEQPRRRPLVRIGHGTCGGILLSIPLRISRGDLQPLPPPPQKEFLCEVCGKGFRSRGAFRKHRVSHAEAPHPLERFLKGGSCLLCGCSSFDSRSEEDIRAHLSTHLSRDQFEQLEGVLSAHRAARKRFVCDVCGRGFNRRGTFWRHCALHRGDPAYRCSVCRRKFTTKTALAKHKRSSHARQTHRCGTCGMRFKLPQHLRNHVAKNHPAQPDP